MRANTFWQIESCSVTLCEWWQHSFVFMKASSSLRWKDQGFQTGAGVIFPMALPVCLVHWTESVTMTVIADFRLWWHPHWPHVLLLLISLPLHFFHIFLLPCFSAPARLFLARSLRLGWKHVGKYHSRIHRSRKSWSNKSFESLLQHVSKPDSPMFQHRMLQNDWMHLRKPFSSDPFRSLVMLVTDSVTPV